MKPLILYCYDAYCGWCYGFSNVIKQLEENYKYKFDFEVLSGGMIQSEKSKHIGFMASYIEQAFPLVEETTGIKFGDDYLWHIYHPEMSDWYPSSEMPAIALCILKEYYPEKQVAFATDMQHALHFEGRDLCDREAYRHLLDAYSIPVDDFYEKLKSKTYKQMAYDEFELCKQLQVSGFPSVYVQQNENQFYLLSNGYMPYETLSKQLDEYIKQNTNQKSNT